MTGLTAENRAAETELRRRIDNYLVRRGRPQTMEMLAFIFGDRRDVLRAIVKLERQGKVQHSRAGWEATSAPD